MKPPTRIVLESNHGGLPVILCGCGVLILEGMEDKHTRYCWVFIQHHGGAA